jgi:hypothetical protein
MTNTNIFNVVNTRCNINFSIIINTDIIPEKYKYIAVDYTGLLHVFVNQPAITFIPIMWTSLTDIKDADALCIMDLCMLVDNFDSLCFAINR